MDWLKILADLRKEKERVERAIQALETMEGKRPAATRRRGRKDMSDAERLQVSERMRKYWAYRRKLRAGGDSIS